MRTLSSLPLSSLLALCVFTIGSAQGVDQPAKVRPPADPEHFGQRARTALDERRYEDALDLIVQAETLQPSSDNGLTHAEILVALGRLREAYTLFGRLIKLDKNTGRSHEMTTLVAYVDASRAVNDLDRANALSGIILSGMASNPTLNASEGVLHPINPGFTRDPKWADAANLIFGTYGLHRLPGLRGEPKTSAEMVARFREIDRLAPSWDRVWSLLLWDIDRRDAVLMAFARPKVERLLGSTDPEVRRAMLIIRKYTFRDRDLIKTPL